MKKALFLDRDGVINKEKCYLYRIEDFEFISGVFETTKYFQNLGYLLIIITNQAGIARRKYTLEDYNKLTQWMLTKFEENSVKIDKVYFCPHHPDFTGECECRKPKPGMLHQASQEFNIDLKNSILVGDKNTDIEAGKSAGIGFNFLISTGHLIKTNRFSVEILSSLIELKNKLIEEN